MKWDRAECQIARFSIEYSKISNIVAWYCRLLWSHTVVADAHRSRSSAARLAWPWHFCSSLPLAVIVRVRRWNLFLRLVFLGRSSFLPPTVLFPFSSGPGDLHGDSFDVIGASVCSPAPSPPLPFPSHPIPSPLKGRDGAWKVAAPTMSTPGSLQHFTLRSRTVTAFCTPKSMADRWVLHATAQIKWQTNATCQKEKKQKTRQWWSVQREATAE